MKAELLKKVMCISDELIYSLIQKQLLRVYPIPGTSLII